MKNNFRKLITTSLLLVTALLNNGIIAKPNSDYQIEVIVFKNLSNTGIFKEGWPTTVLKPPANAQLINNDDGDASNPYYKLLPNSQLAYNSINAKLKRSSSYAPIAHLSWLQPKKDLNNSKTIYFTAGNQFKANSGSEPAPEVSGTLKLALKKYVHASVNTQLNLPITQNSSGATIVASAENIQYNQYSVQPFVINEQRRLKNDEVNFFDNPAFGMILIVKEV